LLCKYSNIVKPSHTSYLPAYEDGTDGVPKRRHIKFGRRGITQKRAYNETHKPLVTLPVLLKTFTYICCTVQWPYSVLPPSWRSLAFFQEYWVALCNPHTGVITKPQKWGGLGPIGLLWGGKLGSRICRYMREV